MPEAVSYRRGRWRTVQAVGPYPELLEFEQSKLDRFLAEIYGQLRFSLQRKGGRRLTRMADAVDGLAKDFEGLSEEQLRAAADDLRGELQRFGFEDATIARAFALTREVSHRRLGLRHHRSQIMGGYVMLQGGLAEMETGEGKTITALLPAVTAALTSQPVHVITVNEYLAERDAAQLRPVYEALGLSVGMVRQGQEPVERRAAYSADVTYCTNSDLTFDYLRDRMGLGNRRARTSVLLKEIFGRTGASAGPSLLLRGLFFVLIDEADSVLIDEARTPLILSGGNDGGPGGVVYETALGLAQQLVRGEDFHLDENERAVQLTPEGRDRASSLASLDANMVQLGLWQSRRACQELVEKALSALHLFHIDTHYIVADGKVQIVDEYTGRVMPDRSWEGGLHQMIEVKEGCITTGQRQTQARITYQRFFRRYLRLCGMSGTVGEAAGELWAVFGLRVVRIPTHRPLRRKNLGTRLYATSLRKWQAVIERAQDINASGRPLLIGTRSVSASEEVSRMLSLIGLPHEVLNARQDKQEADIVATAGRTGSITVATNMAGRGTDIKLPPEVVEAGGLHVILTEFHESARIDRQLFGRCARQGNPGSVEAIVSLADDLFVHFVGTGQRRIITFLIEYVRSDRLSRWAGTFLRWKAQRTAERTHAKIRRETVAQDKRFDKSLAFAGKSE